MLFLPTAKQNSRDRFVLAVYTATIFCSAVLLFSVQPLFTKMVLPQLGGSPGVWSVAMVFFQSLLLAGYAYAHLITQSRSRKFAVGIHIAVLLAAMLTLPLSVAAGWGNPPESGSALWLLGLFTISIGLPFFAISASSPLLQAWFVGTGHPSGHDPYFLYASSNIGSFLALISYPLLIEPNLSLHVQTQSWTWGFALLTGLIAVCGVLLLRSDEPTTDKGSVADETRSKPSWLQRLRWVVLSAVPSGLLVAVTAHISTDVAAAPLLWVVPLSLYLLTWVLVFQTRPLLPHRFILKAAPIAVAIVILLLALGGVTNIVVELGLHLLCFFIITMACHGELATSRPHPRYLTSFYFLLSFGGMVGGLFAGLLAPHLFSWIAEYPILIALAVLCLPRDNERSTKAGSWFWPVFAALALLFCAPIFLRASLTPALAAGLSLVAILVLSIAVMFLAVASRADRFQIFALVVLALTLTRFQADDAGTLYAARSFFGVHEVVALDEGRYHVLMNGTTLHGAQQMLDVNGKPLSGKPEPITYYHQSGGMGQAISAVRAAKGGPLSVAVIGLGTGSLACAATPGETWKFFEIDPIIVDLAKNPDNFSFISQCMPGLKPVIGDARLTIAQETDGLYDLIIVDAYSSDAVPVHLATAEAMAIYKRKLTPNGAVVMHITNRHLDLSDVVVGIADANGMASWVSHSKSDRSDEFIFRSSVVISARDGENVGPIATSENWVSTPPQRDLAVWTDDYSNIVGAFWRGLQNHR
jgi:hypothetical protein